jgi:hypothetical protein
LGLLQQDLRRWKIVEPRIAHNEAIQAAELPHITLHGLRRSFGTLSEWVEVPVGVVAQIQGHKPSAIAEKHYRRRPLDLLRMWHDKIETWMLEQAGIRSSPQWTKVVPFPNGALYLLANCHTFLTDIYLAALQSSWHIPDY